MKKRLIKKYNQLNSDFYQQISADFSDSRQYDWAGWHKILPVLEKIQKKRGEIKVLDLACGNARFASFLKKNFTGDFYYCGLDNSKNLLKLAKRGLRKEGVTAKLISFDLVDNYLKSKSIDFPFEERFDVIVAFGLSHHLPSDMLRREFLASLKKILSDDGLMIISNWQFGADKERFQKNILNLEKIKRDSNLNLLKKIKLKKLVRNLEKKDYLLDWRRFQKNKNKSVYRYCHFLDEREMKELCRDNNLEIVDSFFY